VLQAHDRYLYTILSAIKRKQALQINLKDVEKRIKEVSAAFKKATSDSTLLFLLKQHSRAQFVTFAFLKSETFNYKVDE